MFSDRAFPIKDYVRPEIHRYIGVRETFLYHYEAEIRQQIYQLPFMRIANDRTLYDNCQRK